MIEIEEYEMHLIDNEIAANTRKNYLNTLRQLDAFLEINDCALSKAALIKFKQYLREHEYKPKKRYTMKTINQKITSINVYLNWLEREEFITDKLSIKLLKAQTMEHRESITKSDYKKLLKNCDDEELELFILTIGNTGVRITEVCSLKVSDLNQKTILVENKRKERAISVKMNAAQITDADITDMRSNPTVCGWSTPFDNINVDGIVDQYKGIFAQADVEFQAWFQNLKNQLDDNQAANIQNQIDAINGVIVQKDIPDGANLDDYKTEGEFSKKTPTVVEGAPEGVTGAFRLSVRTMLGSSGVFQTLYDYATRSMYYRIGNTTLGFNLPWQKVVTDVEDVPWTDLTPGTGVLVPSDATLKYRIKSGYITIVASNVQTTIDSNGQKLLTALPLSLFSKFTFVGTIFTGNATNVWRVGISGYNLYVAGTAGVRSNYVSFSVTLPIN
ncbi:tyrosine-type recombinase/integrase [Lactococcus garvieae]|uniref:tyrosine-type recombinase/integrase n=1 Tax=Lactococcus garvieae TaxID=1363 RepID=UPI0022DFE561|nr:tyrosine-type recombinase/integrase [Lactococcus garvieae]